MGKDRISSQEIADYTNINATQIRRDLSNFGKFGKRGVGYSIDGLLGEIRKILRTQGQHNIALVGAGRLGQAIAGSPIFVEHGITIAAVFDIDDGKVGTPIGTSRSARLPAAEGRRPRQEHRRRRARRAGRAPPSRSPTTSSRRACGSSSTTPKRCSTARRRDRAHARIPPSSCCTRSTSTSPRRLGADPPLARVPARRDRLERLHAGARARVEPRRATRSPSSARSAHPERYDLGGARGRRPELPGRAAAGLRPRPTTRGSRRGCSRTSAPSERDALRRGERRGAARAPARPTSSSRTTCCWAAPSAPASAGRFRVKAHGSELEYSMRGRPELERWARGGARRGRGGVRRLASTSATCSSEVVGPRRRGRRGAARASTSTSSCRRRATEALAALLAEARARPAEPGQRATSGSPTRATPRGSRAFLAGDAADRRLLRQADREQGRAAAARGARGRSTRAR